MAIDPRYYQVARTIESSELPHIASGEFVRDHGHAISHACQPEEAQKGAVILVGTQAYLDKLALSDEIVLITNAALAPSCPEGATVYCADNPRACFAAILSHLYAQTPHAKIEATAKVSPSAKIGENVSIGDYAVIEDGAEIGDDCVIGAHVLIGKNTHIGAKSHIHAHSVISFANIGTSVVIHAHAVIGKSGFGFEMTPNGAVMIPHLGIVEIGDHVHIGAHTVIDKAVLGTTSIGAHVMIDNHVHIAHNVQIGEKVIILAQVGIAGSAVIGKNVIIAGQVGVKDHVTIADGAIILSAAKVIKDIDKAGTYAGYPAIPAKQQWREQAAIRRLVAKKVKGD